MRDCAQVLLHSLKATNVPEGVCEWCECNSLNLCVNNERGPAGLWEGHQRKPSDLTYHQYMADQLSCKRNAALEEDNITLFWLTVVQKDGAREYHA